MTKKAERSTTDGPIRNKERTRNKIIDSVGAILKKEGFTGINITTVAAKAKVDRKLIYDYFGGLDRLVKEYLTSRDFWRFDEEKVGQILEEGRKDHGKGVAYMLLEQQFDSLMSNEEMRRIITWGLCENSKPLTELNEEREQIGEELFSKITDEHFKNKDKNMRAIEAILISSIYYLTLQTNMNGQTICGIDLKQKKGQAEIKKALKQIIDWAYS